MDATAIEVVTQALRDRLAPSIGDVYVGPLDDPDARTHPAVLFLYRIAINADLRNREHRLPPLTPGSSPRAYLGALPLDLYYLFTAGTQETGGELNALSLLGTAMQVLNDAPELAGAAVQGETARISLDPVSSEEMSRVWTLFPTANYRTSVIYLVSPVWIDPAQPPPGGPPVTSESYGLTPLPGAEVETT